LSPVAAWCCPRDGSRRTGLDAWAQVLARGYEGYVAKDEASPYRAGVTRSWLKVKVPG
jgi:ATP-dependent DNA ligase